MRVELRKIPNYSSSIKPLNKIAYAIYFRYLDSEAYKRKQEMKEERLAFIRVQKEEELKSVILARIQLTLGDNHYFKDRGLTTKSTLIAIPNEYREELNEVLTHKEFLPFKIETTNTVKDTKKLFNNFPIFISVSRAGDGD